MDARQRAGQHSELPYQPKRLLNLVVNRPTVIRAEHLSSSTGKKPRRPLNMLTLLRRFRLKRDDSPAYFSHMCGNLVLKRPEGCPLGLVLLPDDVEAPFALFI